VIVTAAAAAEYLAKFQALRDPSELRRADCATILTWVSRCSSALAVRTIKFLAEKLAFSPCGRR
jgi:hypothetical protein